MWFVAHSGMPSCNCPLDTAAAVTEWVTALDELFDNHRPRGATMTAAVTVGCSRACVLQALVGIHTGRRRGVAWALRSTPSWPAEPLWQLASRPDLGPSLLAASGVTLLTRQLAASPAVDVLPRVLSLYAPPLRLWHEFVVDLDATARSVAVEVFGALVSEGMTVADALLAAPALVR